MVPHPTLQVTVCMYMNIPDLCGQPSVCVLSVKEAKPKHCNWTDAVLIVTVDISRKFSSMTCSMMRHAQPQGAGYRQYRSKRDISNHLREEAEADLVVQVWHQAAQIPTDCECADMDESQPDPEAGEQGVCDRPVPAAPRLTLPLDGLSPHGPHRQRCQQVGLTACYMSCC